MNFGRNDDDDQLYSTSQKGIFDVSNDFQGLGLSEKPKREDPASDHEETEDKSEADELYDRFKTEELDTDDSDESFKGEEASEEDESSDSDSYDSDEESEEEDIEALEREADN